MAAQPEAAENSALVFETEHGIYRPLSFQAKEVRLITLRDDATSISLRYDMHVVDIDRSPNYSALSYAWGAPLPIARLKSISIDGIAFKIRPTLFYFLQSMAMHHRDKSMWIDTICINQADIEERNYQVSLMGDIYQQAHEVYAWLGTGDADTAYAIEHINGHDLQTQFNTVMFSMCVEKLLKFTYWTRRWVIQEFALARNLILVCGDDQLEWYKLTERVDLSVVKADVLASATLEAFKKVTSLTRQDLTLLELMERFHSARCSVSQDRAYALRSIASDGWRLAPNYSEPLGTFYFRLLSMLPTERVLPRLQGYRWPHKAGARIGALISIDRHVLLKSLENDDNDKLYVVLEYIGRVSRAEPRTIEEASYPNFTHRIFVDGIKDHLLSPSELEVGQLVYTLQTSPYSPEGLYVTFGSNFDTNRTCSLLVTAPTVDQTAYWRDKGLSSRNIQELRNIVSRGIIRCVRNLPVNSFTSISEQSDLRYRSSRDARTEREGSIYGQSLTERRVLCHINREMMISLWFLDTGRISDLVDLIQSRTDETERFGRNCNCMKQMERAIDSSTDSATDDMSRLEILPAFWSVNGDDIWNAAHTDLWHASYSESNHKQPLSDGNETSAGNDTGISHLTPPNAIEERNLFLDGGRSEISYAAGEGLIKFVRQMLKSSSFSSASDNRGRCPLAWAAYGGHSEVLQLLLSNPKFDINKEDTRGRTSLYWASHNGHLHVVECLLGSGVKKLQNRSTDPLFAASENGHRQIVDILVKHGFDVNVRSVSYYKTPLAAAAAAGHQDIVRRLLDGGADICDGQIPEDAMWAASSNGKLDIVQLLLERGATVNSSETGYCHHLNIAASNGHLDVLKLLLKHGAITNRDSVYEKNELQAASEGGHRDIVEFLLEKGLDVNKAEPHGTALTLASSRGHLDVVKLLLEYGADPSLINSPDPNWSDTNTAVYEASKYGHLQVVQSLIEYGADVNGEGGLGNNAIKTASQRGHFQVVKLLLEQGADPAGSLRQATRHDHFEIVKLLLDRDADIANIDDALEQASYLGRREISRLLLNQGVDVNLDLALTSAAEKNHIDIVELLLERGANPNVEDAGNDSLLTTAEADGYIEVAQLLRRYITMNAG